ncbi:MAG TPA: tetratricopeptide repeat protein [Sedimenticola sp.]|nr:tetratricopeptide repeat protein [Sedimenticola sp.]
MSLLMDALKKVEQAKSDADRESPAGHAGEPGAGERGEPETGMTEPGPHENPAASPADDWAAGQKALLPAAENLPPLPRAPAGEPGREEIETLDPPLELPEPELAAEAGGEGPQETTVPSGPAHAPASTEPEPAPLPPRLSAVPSAPHAAEPPPEMEMMRLATPDPAERPSGVPYGGAGDRAGPETGGPGIELDIMPASIRPPPGSGLRKKLSSNARRLAWGGVMLGVLSLLGAGYVYLDTLLNDPGDEFLVRLPWSAPEAEPTGAVSFDPLEEDRLEPPAAPAPGVPPGREGMDPGQPGKPAAPAAVVSASAPAAPEPVVDQPPAAPVKANMAEPSPQAQPAEAPEQEPPQPAVAKPPIRIIRERVPARRQRLLERAYAAYLAGDLAGARQDYLEALKHAPDDRNGLLGLAAIAQRRGDIAAARRYYRRLLDINPADSVAASGMIGLQEGADAVQGESRLKMLLDLEPEAAHLHFALGTQYVSQSRWAEAQQSFFQAHRYDPGNADYMFNLAVSLDRLGQGDAALQYYRKALAASAGRQAGFDPAAARKRIEALTAGKGGA